MRIFSFFLYLICTGFILGWWTLAFFNASPSPSPIISKAPLTSPLPALSPLDRDTIKAALDGNPQLMLSLITQWDQEAETLQERGLTNIQRLSLNQYNQAIVAAHLLTHLPKHDLAAINDALRPSYVIDDKGNSLDLRSRLTRFLPQTYLAASFLFALTTPDQLVAIHKGLRALPHLYSPQLLQQIPRNVDQFTNEQLYLAKPELVFVSHYSHPPTLQRLRAQGFSLYVTQNIDTLEEIQQALIKTGQASNRILESQLLCTFIESCLKMIDNRFEALHTLVHPPNRKVNILYLYYDQHYKLPTAKCLTGQLLQRVLLHHSGLVCPIGTHPYLWQIPFEREKIAFLNPDCLIISRHFNRQSTPDKDFSSALKQLKAFANNKAFFVDEAVQESPTQYIILAYLDIYQALAAFYS